MDDPPEAVRQWRDRGRTVEIDGRSLFVIEEGGPDAPAVLILHGFPGSSFDWHLVLDDLSGHLRVAAFDFLGYGLSEKPPEDRFSLVEQADRAERVAGLAGIERCALVSHDMGDSVASELLRRDVDGKLSFRVERVVLTNGSIFIDMAQLSPGQEALLSMPDEPLAGPFPVEAFRPGLEATFSSDHPPGREQIDSMIWLLRRGGGDRLLPRLIRYIEERRRNQDRWTEGLVRFPGPMTALWGEQDPIAVVGMAHRLKELRPQTEVVTWPDLGHWPMLEGPDRLAQAILERVK